MAFIPILLLSTLVFTFVIFLKNLSAQQWRPAITQLVAYLAGVGGVFLMAAAKFAGGIMIGNQPLDKLNFWSKVLVGVLAASLLSALNEFKKAFDRTDTAVVPDWFEPKAEATAHAHLVIPTQVATPEAMAEARRTVESKHGTHTG